MIEVGHVILTDDIKDEYFVCDLAKCRGGCCVEGDLGAPLTKEELPVLREIYPQVAPYLTTTGRKHIEQRGPYILDDEGEYSTTTIGRRECAFAVYDSGGILKCGIEQAYLDGKVTFQKPISCHLYPLRITRYARFEAVNYDRWHICKDACTHGMNLKVPLYKFLKQPLIRKFGEGWYKELTNSINNRI